MYVGTSKAPLKDPEFIGSPIRLSPPSGSCGGLRQGRPRHVLSDRNYYELLAAEASPLGRRWNPGTSDHTSEFLKGNGAMPANGIADRRHSIIPLMDGVAY